MRRQVMNSGAKPTATPSTILAPVGGWNVRDPLANMQSRYALVLDNFFPRASDLQMRKGYVLYSNCYDTYHPTRPPFVRLLSYAPATYTNNCLFAVSDEGFVKLDTSKHTTPILEISSPATNGLWQSTNFSNAAGDWLWCCCGDGTNKARVYNGTEWTILDETSTPALDYSTEWIDVCSFKRRIWLARANSDVLYYLDVLAIGGTAESKTLYSLPLGALWNRGGSIIKIMNLTLDSGDGADDYLCIFSTEGQVAVYKGNNPNNDNDWGLVGIYDIPRPLGTNCFIKYGGDIILMTENGLLAFSEMFQTIEVKHSIMTSAIIHNAWLEAVEKLRRVSEERGLTLQQGGQYCSLCLYGEQNMLICNFLNDYRYNTATEEQQFSFVQFVLNTDSKAWCRFKNLNMTAFTNHRDSVYCVADRYFYKFWEGYTDNNGFISAVLKTAYMFPSGRGTNSRITLIRPAFQAQVAEVKYSLVIDSDYVERQRLKAPKTIIGKLIALWDEAIWDEAYWQGEPRVSQDWTTISHYVGKAMSLRLKLTTKGQEVALVGFDLITQSGGMI